MKPETRFRVNKINPFLDSLKKVYVDAIQQAAKVGSLDYYMCLHSRFVALEAKDDAGELSATQRDNLFLIRRAGGIGIAVSQTGKAPETIAWEPAKILLTKLAKGEPLDESDQRNANHPLRPQGDV